MVGPIATQRFHDMMKLNTPPAIFKGFFDLYMEGVTLTMLSAFKDLVEIGRVNKPQVGAPHLEWATAQTQADAFARSGGDSQLGDNVLSTEERKMPK